MSSPFDWRTVLLAKHAQHVALIHFPIALFIAAVVLDGLAAWRKKAAYSTAAFINLSAAAICVFPALLTGVAAWQWQLEGQKLKGILLYHLLSALVSSSIILLSWWMQFRSRREQEIYLPSWVFPLELVGVVLIMLTGHLGGFLSGVNT